MGHDKGSVDTANLQKRVKALLKEPENLRCSECRSKKNKPKYFSVLQTPERGQLGVFCCKDCHAFHLALGEDYCTVKSLKKPEEWTEQDVATLEKSGNKAVNAIYESGLEGNHTDKHMGALASAAFVESKYKQCIYFSEKALEEQLQLRAMQKFAKDQQPREQPKPPTVEDQVKRALKRQSMMPVPAKHSPEEKEEVLLRGLGDPHSTGEEKGEVLLRGFGGESKLDESGRNKLDESECGRKPRRTSGMISQTSHPGRIKATPRRSKTWDGLEMEMPKTGHRRSKKPNGDLSSGSRRPGPRGGPVRRSNTADMTGDNYYRRSVQRCIVADATSSSHRPRRTRRPSTTDLGKMPTAGHRRPQRGHSGPTEGGNPRLRQSTTADRASKGSGCGRDPGLRRSHTVDSKSRTGDRLAKRAPPPQSSSSGVRRAATHQTRHRNNHREELHARSSRGERRSLSPAPRNSRSPSSRSLSPHSRSLSPHSRSERSLSPVRSHKDRKRPPGPGGSIPSIDCSDGPRSPGPGSSIPSIDGSEGSALRNEPNGLLSDGDSLLGASATYDKSNRDNSHNKNEESWSDLMGGVRCSRSSAKALIDETLNTVGSESTKKRRSSSKKFVQESMEDLHQSQSEQSNLSFTDGVTWSRGAAPNNSKGRRGSDRRQMLLDAGENLNEASLEFHKQEGSFSVSGSGHSGRRSSSTAEMANLEQDFQQGVDGSFAADSFTTDPLGTDPFGADKTDPFGTDKSDPFGADNAGPFGGEKTDPFGKDNTDPFGTDPFGTADDAFGTSFSKMGFPDFSADSNGPEDEEDMCLLSNGISLSS